MSDKNRMNKDQKKIKRWDNLIDKLSKSFNEGEIIEQGTHDILLSRKGHYHKLHNMQNLTT